MSQIEILYVPAGRLMDVNDNAELLHDGLVVAIGKVFSVTPSADCHGYPVGVGRAIINVTEAIVPKFPLPYPTGGADVVEEAVQSYILWDRSNLRVLNSNDNGGRNVTINSLTSGAVATADEYQAGGEEVYCEHAHTQRVIPTELLQYKTRSFWKGKKVTILARVHGRVELARGKIVYPDSSVCINGTAVGEENARIMVMELMPNLDPSLLQTQLPNYTVDQPLLSSWPIRLLKLEENGWILGDLYSAYDDADFGREEAQDRGGSQKRHYHSVKRKLLTPEERSAQKLQKRGASKLTDESIREAIAKGCGCPKQCWKNWSIDQIREERKDIYGVKHDQKLDLLFAKIDASKQRKDGMVLFKDGHFVCRTAFYNFHGIARSSFYTYKVGLEAGAKQGFHGNTGSLKPREKTIHVFSAMKMLLEEMSEPMPHLAFDNSGKIGTDNICHKLPSCYTQKDLYEELKLRMEQSEHGMVSLTKFYTMWESSFANFSFHNRSAFATCMNCAKYRALLTRERNVELRKQYEVERETHLQLQMSGRTNYYSHNLLAISEPHLFKSGIHDGMNSNKTAVPKLGYNVKALSGVGMPLLVKIVEILNRGDGPPSCAHVCIGGLWLSDPNFTISSVAKYLRDCENFNGDMRGDLAFLEELEHPLLRSLHNRTIFEKTYLAHKKKNVDDFLNPRETLAQEGSFNKLPPTFYIQLDNSGKDNKNWAVLAFLSELVARGVFTVVIASFLQVGHTHEDVDAFFSKINQVLSGKHVSSIPQLLVEVYGAEEKKSLPRFMIEVADYKAHAKPYHQKFKGIRTPVAFKFSMLDNHPIYQYQCTYGGPWLPTFGNSIWKRKNPKSTVDFSVVVPPNRNPVNVGMNEKHANAEDITSYLKAYIRLIESIQMRTDSTSDLYSTDQAIKDYWSSISTLLVEGWPTNKGEPLKEGFWPRTDHGTGYKRASSTSEDSERLEQDLLAREADEELAKRDRPFVGSVVERDMENFTPILDIQLGHMIIIRPTQDFLPKDVVWLAKAVSTVNRDSNDTYHNHVRVEWYRPKHRSTGVDDKTRYKKTPTLELCACNYCMRKAQECEKDPFIFPEKETWVDANACVHSWKSQGKAPTIKMSEKILSIARSMIVRAAQEDI